MTAVQPRALVEHVLRLGGLGVAVSLDIGADVGEEVRAVAGGGDGAAEARELGAVLGEDLAVAGEVGGFQGGGGRFAVELARELGEEG